MTRRAAGLLLLAAIAAAAFYRARGGEPEGPSWRTGTVERGDLKSVVSATGTLEAVTTVEVGTQVSGIISEILVDFNDLVKKGQVIARIDEALLRIDVEGARARLAQAEAERDLAVVEHRRIATLRESDSATERELETARSAAAVAEAVALAARTSYDRARKNLAYATIAAPIDGTVVERAVDVGQTVNAGFSAPRLFTIAGDLSRMRILAAVDEADIGRIREGQEVDFNVQAWPDDTFHGTVRQVRLQSALQENVVTYTAVVDVANDDGRLLPGMTATVEFVAARARDVLSVPGAALRFRPPGAGDAGAGRPGRPGGGEGRARRGEGRRGGAEAGGGPKRGTVHLLGQGGDLVPVEVELGLEGEDRVEVRANALAEGAEVAIGTWSGGPGGGGSSPFQPAPTGERRPPGSF
ncbi:efflux RND transporter periplasmic adaptor subunit [Myxococcota bacterium]|nr:efflux RND transporter periplasmic adaptor subunit [Myxococcota bacterium]